MGCYNIVLQTVGDRPRAQSLLTGATPSCRPVKVRVSSFYLFGEMWSASKVDAPPGHCPTFTWLLSFF
jgi:hypothetical protein